MSAQLSANASRNINTSHVVVNNGIFTFRVDRIETRFFTFALASSIHNHFENYCLVGKRFGKSVFGRVIRHRLKNDWKFLQGDVSIDHIGREWYKVEFFYEEDIRYVLENRPWFVQGQIFTLKMWSWSSPPSMPQWTPS